MPPLHLRHLHPVLTRWPPMECCQKVRTVELEIKFIKPPLNRLDCGSGHSQAAKAGLLTSPGVQSASEFALQGFQPVLKCWW
jgi:hypothetical protein